MKSTHVLVQGNSMVGEVVEHEKFGRVFILDRFGVSLTNLLEIYALDSSYESDSVDLLDLLLTYLRIDKDE